MASAKQAAKDMLEQVPDKATWDEIMYELYIKQKNRFWPYSCREWSDHLT